MIMYHGSNIINLSTLWSSDTKSVYLTTNKNIALIFTTKFNDFEISVDIENEKPIIREHIEGIKEKIYNNKVGAIYSVDVDSLILHKTQWSGELVCNKEIRVESVEIVNDTLKYINQQIETGNIIYKKYGYFSASEEYNYLIKKSIQYYNKYGIKSILSLQKLHPVIYKSIQMILHMDENE